MAAMHFSNVDLPLPLRPTMPKNSPDWTAKLTSLSAGRGVAPWPRKGWSTRSLSVWTRSCGRRKVFETPSTKTAGRASDTPLSVAPGSAVPGEPHEPHDRLRGVLRVAGIRDADPQPPGVTQGAPQPE